MDGSFNYEGLVYNTLKYGNMKYKFLSAGTRRPHELARNLKFVETLN